MRKILLLILITTTFITILNAQTIRFAKPGTNGVGNGTGSSWANAGNLQNMIYASNAGDEVWVAKGTYEAYTNRDGNYESTAERKTFKITSGVSLYGGFAGTEISLAERNLNNDTTILDGKNLCSHVVSIYYMSANIKLDGFTIQNGKSYNFDRDSTGAGINVQNVFPGSGKLFLTNCVIKNNTVQTLHGTTGGNGANGANYQVGGVGSNGGNGQIAAYGGGIYLHGANAIIENCVFLNNKAIGGNGGTGGNGGNGGNGGIAAGGGIYATFSGDVQLKNCTFYKNMATSGSGGTEGAGGNGGYYSGGTFCSGSSNGLADNGWNGGVGMSVANGTGAIGLYNYPVTQYDSVINCILWGNSTNNIGGSDIAIVNSNVQGAYVSNGNIFENPLFVSDSSMALQNCSPAINKGKSTSTTKDIVSKPRTAQGLVDMGAYENQTSYGHPTTFNMTGTGKVCPPATIGLSNSQLNIVYQLKLNGIAVGTSQNGTGAALSFGSHTLNGKYIITGYDTLTGCEWPMNGFREIKSVPEVSITSNAASNILCPANPVTLTVVTNEAPQGTALDINDVTNSNVKFTSALPDTLAKSKSFTVEGWVKIQTPTGWVRFFDFAAGAGNNNIIFGLSENGSGKPFFQIINTIGGNTTNGNKIKAPYALFAGYWYHLALTYDSTNRKATIFVNGDSVVSDISTVGIRQATGARTESFLGYSAWGDRSDILMDEVRFWDTAFSANTINANKDRTFAASHPFASHLLARYTFEGNANNVQGNVTYNGTVNNANTNGITTTPCTWSWLPTGAANTNAITDNPINSTTYNLTYATSNGCTILKDYTVSIGKLFVDSSKITGLNNGSNWDNAYTKLDSALKNTITCFKEIWVAKGTYKPTNGVNRDSSFVIPNGVKVYGGFAGGEVNLMSRNIITNTTILSGDIGIANNITDNSYHVVSIRNANANTLLDGFTVTNGQGGAGSNAYGNNGDGAGLYINYPNSGLTSSPTIANCTITDNNSNYGAGVFIEARGTNCISKPIFNDCIFNKDTAVNNGAAIGYYGAGDDDTAVFNRCLFTQNKATNGSGIMADGNTQLSVYNSVFDSNRADNQGAGVFTTNGNDNIIANTVFTNGNTNNGGSAILNSTGTSNKIINCTMFGNKQGANNSALYNFNCNTEVTNTVITGSNGNTGSSIFNSGTVTEAVTYSNVQLTAGVYTGVGNTNYAPLFKDSLNLKGADGNWFTNDDGLTLKSNSLLINAGNNAAIPASISNDIANNARINFTKVDMGAYEFSAGNCNGVNTWIGIVSTDWNNASNWTCNVPTAADEVVIRSAVPYMPVVNASTSIKKIIVNAGASVIVNTGKTLTLLGN